MPIPAWGLIAARTYTAVTDAYGQAVLRLRDGTYAYGVKARGCNPMENGSLTVNGAALGCPADDNPADFREA